MATKSSERVCEKVRARATFEPLRELHQKARIKPPATYRRPNRHMLTYESECVYKTCVVCLVWLLSCLCSWPHADQTNSGCLSPYEERWSCKGGGGSRWRWVKVEVTLRARDCLLGRDRLFTLEWVDCIMLLPNFLFLFFWKFSSSTVLVFKMSSYSFSRGLKWLAGYKRKKKPWLIRVTKFVFAD